MNATVTVFTKADCQPCRLTGMKLRQKLIPFTPVSIEADPDARAKAESYGYLQAPVVVVELGDGAEWTWAGFRPSEIEKLYTLFEGGIAPEGVFAAA